MRLIDADALETRFDDRDAFYLTTQIKKEIRNAPTITPDEVRGVGEWEHQDLAPTNWTFCSVCGRQRSKKYKWYYCPNCGAKMKGEQ